MKLRKSGPVWLLVDGLRLIHHAVILEMTGASFRNEAARKRGDATPATTTTTTDQNTTTTPEANGEM
jgi:hypothetical protein